MLPLLLPLPPPPSLSALLLRSSRPRESNLPSPEPLPLGCLGSTRTRWSLWKTENGKKKAAETAAAFSRSGAARSRERRPSPARCSRRSSPRQSQKQKNPKPTRSSSSPSPRCPPGPRPSCWITSSAARRCSRRPRWPRRPARPRRRSWRRLRSSLVVVEEEARGSLRSRVARWCCATSPSLLRAFSGKRQEREKLRGSSSSSRSSAASPLPTGASLSSRAVSLLLHRRRPLKRFRGRT